MSRYMYHYQAHDPPKAPKPEDADFFRWADIYDSLNETFLSSTGYIDRVDYNLHAPPLHLDHDRMPLIILTEALNNDYELYLKLIKDFESSTYITMNPALTHCDV